MSIVLDNLREMVGYFSDVALGDPLSAILLALGAVLTGVAVTIFGGLSVGGLLSPFTDGKY
jgi:hypothetical protein